MTGNQLIKFCLAQTNTSKRTLANEGEDNLTFEEWALMTMNIVTSDMYYHLQSFMPGDERNTRPPEYHTFNAFSESDYPAGAEDVLILDPQAKVRSIYVRYTPEGEFIRATKMNLLALRRSPEWLSRFQPQDDPIYSIRENEIQIYPKPTESVADGVMVTFTRPYDDMKNLDDPIQGVEPDFHKDLIPLFISYIYGRQEKTDLADYHRKAYEMRQKVIRPQISGKGGDRSRTTYSIQKFI